MMTLQHIIDRFLSFHPSSFNSLQRKQIPFSCKRLHTSTIQARRPILTSAQCFSASRGLKMSAHQQIRPYMVMVVIPSHFPVLQQVFALTMAERSFAQSFFSPIQPLDGNRRWKAT